MADDKTSFSAFKALGVHKSLAASSGTSAFEHFLLLPCKPPTRLAYIDVDTIKLRNINFSGLKWRWRRNEPQNSDYLVTNA